MSLRKAKTLRRIFRWWSARGCLQGRYRPNSVCRLIEIKRLQLHSSDPGGDMAKM